MKKVHSNKKYFDIIKMKFKPISNYYQCCIMKFWDELITFYDNTEIDNNNRINNNNNYA